MAGHKPPLWVLVFWLFLWEMGSRAVGQRILFPSPWETFQSFFEILGEESSWKALFYSITRITLGFLTATVTGVMVAVLSQRWRWLAEILSPLILLAKSVPVACFVILILIWFSSSALSTIISFLMVLPVVYMNTASALRELDPKLEEMCQVFRLSPLPRYRYVVAPQIFPQVESAIILALGLSIKSGIAAELIGMPKNSLGEELYAAKLYFNTPKLFAWTIMILILSYSYEKIIKSGLKSLRTHIESGRWK